MLIECPDGTFLDLGEPLAEYESPPPLPDSGVPWGSWDFQNVHLEPSSHLSVLMLRCWYGEGQYLRFPLRSGDQHTTVAPTVVRLEPDRHLPSNANLSPRWLGRDHAMMFSDDDDDLDKNLLIRLSFSDPSSEGVSSYKVVGASGVTASGRVLREDLLTEGSLLARETRVLREARALSVDEESGRIAVLLRNGEGLIFAST
uniref:Urease ) n=1 Tax=Ganoderma boninense TaxID=34458 RepID=A0A5K1JZQ1_9APHY|nr:Urease (EC (Urea amidohydrolase) [Ganoderma boninense]